MSQVVGVGLRSAHYGEFLKPKPPSSVSWVEVITENFLPWKSGLAGKSVAVLEKVRRNFPVSLHGVSLNLGSADPLDEAYLKNLKALVERIQPIRVSDHLCWTGVGGRNSHDLLPLPYSVEALNLVSEKIQKVQDRLGRRLTVENVSAYFEWSPSEMTEAEFISEVTRRTGCGILLDLNNIFVTAKNLGRSAVNFIEGLPLDSVTQIHLAGPSERADGFLIDTHDSEVREEVWALLEFWARIGSPEIPVMVERDGNIPEWAVLEKELARIPAILGGINV